MSTLVQALISTGPPADRADAMALYGWLVGCWDVDVTAYGDDGARRVTGWMVADWVLDGRAIQDVWHAENMFHGTTLRVYDPAIDAWHIQWTEPQLGVRLTQLGRADAAGIVQDGTLPDGTDIRWSFRDVAADSFRWCDERSRDGRDWQLRQEYRARRVSGH
ncbi:hypothetical protein [Mycobacterium shimoidei]|uniref:Uncharacterized protein n=1 Tax=Mycobacterium shimoidei TaxID=29313 RepID=A0A1E3TFJ0_MYCSH|nr:hypothetical protein [Mycobacterium shimoidei]MCV7259757.1 hypothetical protein [Mycobacterium shimoidei]ODR12430.1 hypothetical protein BHQ16_15720 [Mycobacterium shimoidei]ORW81959.1 hypothetical protein AWC26_06365 [Mycobacterium shimoidei]SRX94028.1 hypothetical protein [Corallococcus coralloides DSM 2259] [Mycobacterium shimoidei]